MFRLRTDLRRLIRDQAGASAVEFAMLAPVLGLLAAGAIDATTLILRTMEVRSAAQAGAEFALVRGWDAANITKAVVDSAPPSRVSALPAPSLDRACVSADLKINKTTATSCPGGGAPGDFVTVRAQSHFKPIVPWPGFEKDLTAQSTVRLQ